MKSVSETRLLSLFSGKSLDGFQVKVIVQMQIVQVLAMYQQIQHVVTLTTDLKPRLHPIQFSGLKKFSLLERSKQIPKNHMTRHMTRITTGTFFSMLWVDDALMRSTQISSTASDTTL